jgi:hypothetical protein
MKRPCAGKIGDAFTNKVIRDMVRDGVSLIEEGLKKNDKATYVSGATICAMAASNSKRIGR